MKFEVSYSMDRKGRCVYAREDGDNRTRGEFVSGPFSSEKDAEDEITGVDKQQRRRTSR